MVAIDRPLKETNLLKYLATLDVDHKRDILNKVFLMDNE